VISTKPNVVKYLASGNVLLQGKAADIKKKLDVNPKTKIPQILFTVYQHVFNSIYMLSSILTRLIRHQICCIRWAKKSKFYPQMHCRKRLRQRRQLSSLPRNRQANFKSPETNLTL
jgi:hypothetical protein